MKKILTVILFLNIQALFAKECEEYNVRIIFDRKPVLTKEVMCARKNSDNMVFYTSLSCHKDKCEILKRKKAEIKIPGYTDNMGSPGFKLCTELGGVPQIFEFQKQSALWQSTERCFFEKDFVEISLLTSEWKKFVTK